MRKKTIAIDMDGVLADIDAQLIDHYNKAHGTALSKESIKGLASDLAFEKEILFMNFCIQRISLEHCL